MVANAALEYRGFLKFMTRANNELRRWFGPYCDNDATRITFMASREWDGMSDLERKPFIGSLNEDGKSRVNAYIRYKLQQRYLEGTENASNNQTFDPKSAKLFGERWKFLSEEQRQQFLATTNNDFGMEHVIEKRNKLHERYEPKKLCILEFILKTKPKWPAGPRVWFHKHECHSFKSSAARDKWLNMTADERGVYERCALLDRKRFDLEKSALITKMLAIDFEADEFTLKDFEIPKTSIESLGSIVEISKDLPPLFRLKRPGTAFSLFVEAYRQQIRHDKRPGFGSGRHLKECSEAWSRLSDEEREFYLNQSLVLRKEFKEYQNTHYNFGLFTKAKSAYGPSRPSHLIPKLQSPMNCWANKNNVKSGKKALWNALPDNEKQIYIEMHEQLKQEIHDRKLEIADKIKHIRQLMVEAKSLEVLKRELRLIGASNKPVRNLYPQLVQEPPIS